MIRITYEDNLKLKYSLLHNKAKNEWAIVDQENDIHAEFPTKERAILEVSKYLVIEELSAMIMGKIAPIISACIEECVDEVAEMSVRHIQSQIMDGE